MTDLTRALCLSRRTKRRISKQAVPRGGRSATYITEAGCSGPCSGPTHARRGRIDAPRRGRFAGGRTFRRRRQWCPHPLCVPPGITKVRPLPANHRRFRVDGVNIVAHHAIAQQARAAGIIARHAADCGARCGGDVDRKPKPVRLELTVQFVEHDAGLDHAAPLLDIQRDHLVEMFRAIDDQGTIDRLAALRSARAARKHTDASVAYRPRLKGSKSTSPTPCAFRRRSRPGSATIVIALL